ncbi:hypothetical protein MPTK1_2g02740 [Marchantia polymorpha subsp. ruderalis]|uniref:Uncharacterized protein n=1 Tax=Marchantia polymorpha TaxID=3197 RepID=A0A2R6WM54_MARPO|nr:hypothetical protein MARPO_0075s0035 [Marchantia polymorpha]BBN00858.1 hypothetical protein Mp_2g02740 [Marchantia polymorpha subsp. ruderalis]|eukprot:PTQ34912.1 hypothetical protein MARPO_0075s0035 [Marchantia polymorpha]
MDRNSADRIQDARKSPSVVARKPVFIRNRPDSDSTPTRWLSMARVIRLCHLGAPGKWREEVSIETLKLGADGRANAREATAYIHTSEGEVRVRGLMQACFRWVDRTSDDAASARVASFLRLQTALRPRDGDEVRKQ